MALLGLLDLLVGPIGVGEPQEALHAIALTTALAIGGGLAAAGGAAGGLLSRPDKRSAASFVPYENKILLDQADQLQDPTYGFGQFRRLANDAAGNADQTLQATAATGGSERLARTRQQAQAQQAANDIMDRFGQFRLQAQQQAANVRQQGIANKMQGQAMAQKQNLARSRATMSAFNSLTNMGTSLMGQGIGGAINKKMLSNMPQPPMSFGQMRMGGSGASGLYPGNSGRAPSYGR
jgi:hypothetical protein